MANERRSEYVGMALVRFEPFQVFAGAATAVIEQDRGKWTAALGAPEQRAQRDRAVVYYDSFRPAGGPRPASRAQVLERAPSG